MAPDYQNKLLNLIKAQDYRALSNLLTHEFPELPSEVQATYTGPDALSSPTSAPAQLLIAATRANSAEIFSLLWDTFYASGSQIPYECLRQGARTGSLPLARAFVQREPRALARTPPVPVPHGRPGAGQLVTALRAGNLEYADFVLEQGEPLDQEWPRVRVLRTAVAWEQSDEELVEKVRWLTERGARIRGAGALRRVACYGVTDAAEVLLDAGADVEDLGDDAPEEETTEAVESALMEAVKAGQLEMVKLLVARGANTELQNAAGESPKTLAESRGYTDIARVLAQPRG